VAFPFVLQLQKVMQCCGTYLRLKLTILWLEQFQHPENHAVCYATFTTEGVFVLPVMLKTIFTN